MDQGFPGNTIESRAGLRSNLGSPYIGFNKYSTNGDMIVDSMASGKYEITMTTANSNTGNKIDFDLAGKVWF